MVESEHQEGVANSQEEKSAEKELISVLYVDDEVNNLTSFKANFRRDYRVYTAESAVEGKKILEQHKIQIIITDQRMPGMTGVEFLESILDTHPDPMRILLTGYADLEAVIDAINKGQVYRYLTKPWEDWVVRKAITDSYEVYSLREKNKQLTQELIDVNKKLEFVLRQKLIS